MDRAMRMVLAGGITLVLSGIAFMIYLAYVRNNPPTTPDSGGPKVSGPALTIPAFSLVDQEGKPQTQEMLKGQVSIVWFMFTRCPLACPAMSVQAEGLQRQLKGSGVRFVAFSLDPAHDTPAVLKEYGGRYEIDWSQWTYLTEPPGSKARTGWDIFTRDLYQHADEKPETVPGKGTEIDHAVRFFLVGPDGNVLEDGWFDSKLPEEMEKLKERARGAVLYYEGKGLLKK